MVNDNAVSQKHHISDNLAKVYKSLQEEVARLHAKWIIFHQLYATSEDRVNFLNAKAPSFFIVVEYVLRDDIFLSMSRLTDPLKTSGKENLSLAQLVENLDDSDLAFHESTSKAVEKIQEHCQPFREWRNRRIAHNDLPTSLEYHPEPLPGISRQMIEEALKMIRNLLNHIQRHFEDAETAYEHVSLQGDGDDLVFFLEQAEAYDKHELESWIKERA